MSAKPSDNRDRIRRICLYGLLSAVCMAAGYLESLIPFEFIAPGVKIGLANSVCLMLAIKGDTKGAFAVNTVRILLSSLLFGTALSLVFSLCAGFASLLCICLLRHIKSMSEIGISIVSAAVHNLTQAAVAAAVTGAGVLYYIPVLLICGAASGALTGMLCRIILKNIKTNRIF